MKRLIVLIIAVAAVSLVAIELATALDISSPTEVSSQGREEKIKETSGLPPYLSPRQSAPLVTIVPSVEFKRLPSFDFLPKRAKGQTKEG
jgi:hypothetical protein